MMSNSLSRKFIDIVDHGPWMQTEFSAIASPVGVYLDVYRGTKDGRQERGKRSRTSTSESATSESATSESLPLELALERGQSRYQ